MLMDKIIQPIDRKIDMVINAVFVLITMSTVGWGMWALCR
jgi:hypothetical protein